MIQWTCSAAAGPEKQEGTIIGMNYNIVLCVCIPFAGTVLGASMVYFLKDQISEGVQKVLSGFAAGVMVAASIWSLLIPALAQNADRGALACVPVAVGFLVGIGFLLLLDIVTPHMHMDSQAEGPRRGLKRTTQLILAVTLHNIPEGMAVGVVCASWLSGRNNVSASAALVLAIGIAIQNFPEGAIVSMPLRAAGVKKSRTFLYGSLSGIVEPVATVLTLLAAQAVTAVLPFLQAFAAGAMIYVVIEELVPEMAKGKHSNAGTIAFSLGFVLMMILDVALG